MDNEKAYDIVLNKARNFLNCKNTSKDLRRFILGNFPELKEEFYDENMRNTIIRVLRGEISHQTPEEINECVSWLDKFEFGCEMPYEMPDEDEWVTTVCGKDYICLKNYRLGDCSYTKGFVYHCSRDGYLTDNNNISWSCSPSWFSEYVKEVGEDTAVNDKAEKTGIERIAAERKRQIEVEGYDEEHDLVHDERDFILAAICYAEAAKFTQINRRYKDCDSLTDDGRLAILKNWPWEDEFFKPSTTVRNLEKAGAIIAAAIDRINSTNNKTEKHGEDRGTES